MLGSDNTGPRLYRTGDLARYLPHGNTDGSGAKFGCSVSGRLAIGVAPDDLFVCLCDVGPGGEAINITDGYRRLSLASGDPRRRTTTVEALPVAWRLDVGHRLRLLVAAGAFPRFARNLGLGEPLAIATESRLVDITVHCCAGASFISI